MAVQRGRSRKPRTQLRLPVKKVTETLLKIGPLLASQFRAPGDDSLQERAGDHSLFLALAWRGATGRVE
jgi:hypothetical protein